MSNAVYPSNLRGLSYALVKTPSFSTIVQSSTNGFECRITQRQNPTWSWQLIYNYLYDGSFSSHEQRTAAYSDLQILMGFFLARQGKRDDFLFSDPDDNSVTGVTLDVFTNTFGTGYSPLRRNCGGFYEDVTDLDAAVPLKIYLDGVLQIEETDYRVLTGGYAVPGASWRGMYIAWLKEPDGTVTADFQFYFRVRFDSDSQDFENFAHGLWTIGGDAGQSGSGVLKLVSARPIPAYLPDQYTGEPGV